MAGVVLPQAATRLRKLILEDAWRSGQRRTPATILLAISTAMTTMLVVAAFLWYIVIIFTPWYNGTTIIAPLMFPTAGLAMLSLGVVSTPRFLGSLTINIIGVALSVLSFVCVLLQVPLMWPGIFDGVAGVPFHSPLVDIELNDHIWPYIAMIIGNFALAGPASLLSLLAFGAMMLNFIFEAVGSGFANALGPLGGVVLRAKNFVLPR